MTILVTGGLGYIGSHFARLATQSGDAVVNVDDESTGLASRNPDIALRRIDVASPEARDSLRGLMEDEGVTSVVHFAAMKRVDDSLAEPTIYFRRNLLGLANVVDAMRAAGVRDIVFSSTAAVYGETTIEIVNEAVPARPINAYGGSKLACEWMLAAASEAFGLRAISLRYFNVGGAGWPELGDQDTSNLIPIIFDRLERGLPAVVFGDDFPTPDGTGVRDYVHVLDIAEAHRVALQALAHGSTGHYALNVGTGRGSSVREVIAEVERVVGRVVETVVVGRRGGDPSQVVADPSEIVRRTGWHAERSLRDIVESAWLARPTR